LEQRVFSPVKFSKFIFNDFEIRDLMRFVLFAANRSRYEKLDYT